VGGNILFDKKALNPDMFSLLIPQFFNDNFMTVLVFIGGFSAAISMIIASSITLSTMLSNNLLIPYGYLDALKTKTRKITPFALSTFGGWGYFCLSRRIFFTGTF
jgi:hypothetical protein